MAVVKSQPPVAYTSGVTPAAPFQLMNSCGVGHHLFYHVFADDFDINAGLTNGNTYEVVTTPGTGTLASTPGDGGLALFTTSGASGDAVGIQQAVAAFTFSAVKKLFYVTKFQLGTVATSSVIAGMISTNTTPFTAVVDGAWFRWTGGGALTFNHAVASVVTSVTIPAAAYTMANATNIELGFEKTAEGDFLIYVDTQLIGVVPQSNLGTTGNPQNAGPVARLAPASLTAAVLKPTLFVQTNSAAVKTMTADFIMAAKER